MKVSTFVLACAVLMVAVVFGSPYVSEENQENVSTKTCPCPEDFPRELNPIGHVKCPPKKRMAYGVNQHDLPQYAEKYAFLLYCTTCSCGSNGYADHCLDLTHKGLYECDKPVNPSWFWEATIEIEEGDPEYDDDWGPLSTTQR